MRVPTSPCGSIHVHVPAGKKVNNCGDSGWGIDPDGIITLGPPKIYA